MLNFDNNPKTSVEFILLDSASEVITDCRDDCRVRIISLENRRRTLIVLSYFRD